jgi:hypothetical protein
MKLNKTLIAGLAITTILSFSFNNAARAGKGGSRSSGHSSGHYSNGSGSSHKGGHYKNSSTNDHYRKRK